jgi:hypothetical protein
MKKLYFVILSLLSLMFYSCEDSVEMFAPEAGKDVAYVMNCVMNINASSQMVNITHSYLSDPANPESYTTDPFLSGAQVSLFYRNNEFHFFESQMERSDTARYKTPRKFYIAQTVPFMGGDSVKLVAKLSNGVVLSSSIEIQHNPTVKCNSTAISNRRTTTTGYNTEFNWKLDPNTVKYYYPRFVIQYQKLINGVLQPTVYEKDIPSRIIHKKEGVSIPEYYGFIRTNKVNYDFEAVDSAMVSICPDLDSRKQYKPICTVLKLLMYDEPLSQYYTLNNGYMDMVTVRLDESDLTNVSGGKGIFGSYLIYDTNVYFEREYVSQLGFYVDPL